MANEIPTIPVATPTEGKALITSWEFWANAIAMLIAYLHLDTEAGWAWLPPKYAALIPFAMGVITILLRWLRTSQPITGVLRAKPANGTTAPT